MSAGRDGAEERRQRVVELRLISRVPVEREAAVLPRRKDRPRRSGVIAPGGRCLERSEEDDRRGDEHRGERDQSSEHRPDATCATKYSPLSVDALLAFAAASSRCGCQEISCGASVRAARPSSPPGPPASPHTHSPRARSPGARRPDGAKRRSASTTSAARCSPRRFSERDRCSSWDAGGSRRRPSSTSAWRSESPSPSRSRPSSRGRRFPRRRTSSTSGRHVCSRSSATRSGTLAVVVVALTTFRSRPVGNALILAGIAVAGIGSGLAGLGIGALAPAIVVAAVLLYAGFVAPSTFVKPHRNEHRHHRERDRGLDDRAGDAPVRH